MRSVDRRTFLRSLAAMAAVPVLGGLVTGCEHGESLCPDEPEDRGGVDFVPDAVRPVFHSRRDLVTSDGTAVRIWYPTYDGVVVDAPLLKTCLPRRGLVLFLHGQGPCGEHRGADSTYYQRWGDVARTLASIGYVVAAPRLPQGNLPGPDSADVGIARSVLRWLRTEWDGHEWLDRDPAALAIVGHSYGGIAGAHVAAVEPCRAFASLSTEFAVPDPAALVGAIPVPSLFVYGGGEDRLNVRDYFRWSRQEACAVVYAGGRHFDYLTPRPGCEPDAGPCPRGRLTGDLLALFVSRHNPNGLERADVGIDLRIPQAQLSFREQFYAGSHHLASIRQPSHDCDVEVVWRATPGDEPGRRTFVA